VKIIQYVNPTKLADGSFRCAVCHGVFDTWERARRHAQADHRKRRKIREAAAAAENQPRKTTARRK
jgi:hypothetical protein